MTRALLLAEVAHLFAVEAAAAREGGPVDDSISAGRMAPNDAEADRLERVAADLAARASQEVLFDGGSYR